MERPRRSNTPLRTAVLVVDRFPFLLFAVAIALAALAGLVATRAHADERYTLDDTKIAIYNLAGTATFEPESGTKATVEVLRGGPDASKLTVGTGRVDDRASLRIIYPGTRIIYPEMGRGSSNTTRVRDDGTFGGRDLGSLRAGRSVKITGSGRGTQAHADLTLRIPTGTDVLLRLAAGEVHVTNVDGTLRIDTGSGEVTASETRGVLSIDTGSGSVRVDHAEGPVSIDTGSGSVDLAHVHGGPLMVDTGSGSVSATNINVPALSIDTGSGRVDAVDVSSKLVHIDTGSGGVNVMLTSIVDEMKVDSGSGLVEIQLPRETGAMLSLETGSGGIETDVPLTQLRRDHGELHGQMGNGRSRIAIETGSGGIRFAGR